MCMTDSMEAESRNMQESMKVQSISTIPSWLLKMILKIPGHTMYAFKVGISGYGNLRTMSTDKWTTSKSQCSTKICVKLLLLLKNALELNFEAV